MHYHLIFQPSKNIIASSSGIISQIMVKGRVVVFPGVTWSELSPQPASVRPPPQFRPDYYVSSLSVGRAASSFQTNRRGLPPRHAQEL